MIAPELAAYVAQARAAGLKDPDIRKNLIDGGWDPMMVNEAVPAPAAAATPAAAPVRAPAPMPAKPKDVPPQPPAAASNELRSLMPPEKTAPSAGLAAAAASAAVVQPMSSTTNGLNYASFWRKFFANLIDSFVMMLPLLLVLATYALFQFGILKAASAQEAPPAAATTTVEQPEPISEPAPVAEQDRPKASCLSNLDCGEGEFTCVNNRCEGQPLDGSKPEPGMGATDLTNSAPTGKACASKSDCGGADQTCVNGQCYAVQIQAGEPAQATKSDAAGEGAPPQPATAIGLGPMSGASKVSGVMRVVLGLLGLVSLGWIFLYRIWYIGRRGATPGMKMLGMRVVLETEPATVGTGVLRALGHSLIEGFLSGATCSISVIWMLVDLRRQTLGDKIMHFVTVHDPSKRYVLTSLAGIPERKKRWVWFGLYCLSWLPLILLMSFLQTVATKGGAN